MAVKEERVPDHRAQIVTAAGAATTLAALAGVFALAHRGENVMGWYANYVIPAGALLVGGLAASGYGIAAWFTGLKMTRRLMLSVCAQLLLSYFIAQYEEYQRLVPGGEIGFFSWFDLTTRAFAFAQHDGTAGSPFGIAGYAMRALEIGGFVLGGFLVPAALHKKPYCDGCRTYRRQKRIALFPGGFPGDGGESAFRDLYAAANTGNRAGVELTIRRLGDLKDESATSQFRARITVWTVRCPRCAGGYLAASRTEGHGKQATSYPLPAQVLTGEQMRALFD
jgi:hypothetical protein